jgi:hypothetical protein
MPEGLTDSGQRPAHRLRPKACSPTQAKGLLTDSGQRPAHRSAPQARPPPQAVHGHVPRARRRRSVHGHVPRARRRRSVHRHRHVHLLLSHVTTLCERRSPGN